MFWYATKAVCSGAVKNEPSCLLLRIHELLQAIPNLPRLTGSIEAALPQVSLKRVPQVVLLPDLAYRAPPS
jgi:hypothetical protein